MTLIKSLTLSGSGPVLSSRDIAVTEGAVVPAPLELTAWGGCGEDGQFPRKQRSFQMVINSMNNEDQENVKESE